MKARNLAKEVSLTGEWGAPFSRNFGGWGWRGDAPAGSGGSGASVSALAVSWGFSQGGPSADGLIFPTRTRAARWPVNVRTAWRKVRGDDYTWVKPHTFRKTVATLVERELGMGAASIQLGHSGIGVTERHYVMRAVEAPDTRTALDKLG